MTDYSNLTVEAARSLCLDLIQSNRNFYEFLSSLSDNDRITVVDTLAAHSLLNDFDLPIYSPDVVLYRLRNVVAFMDSITSCSLDDVDPVLCSHFRAISERLEQLGLTKYPSLLD